ncbi:MAG: rod shape-determining protein RodA [Acidobacteria bacterium]|nr:rod shape-determining protein RodA [Acidobacteriota bacterium]
MIDRRLLVNLDWVLLGSTLLVSIVGVMLVSSASQSLQTGFAEKQASWCAIGLVVMVIAMSIDYHRLADQAPVFYLLVILALMYVLFFGRIISGARSWITLAGFRAQPSEVAKIVLALMLTKYFAEFRQNRVSAREIGAVALIVGIPLLLTAAQPDLGTAVTFLPIAASALILAGMPTRWLVGIICTFLMISLFAWFFLLKDYQKDRLTSFISPEADPKGSGYHSIQSRIAVGSGGFTGKGYTQGTQSRLEFLPARHTDFVFSVLGEEEGFVGTLAVLGLYMLIIQRGFSAARHARDRAGLFLAACLTSLIAFHIIINVGMVAGVLPITGIPLPFLSYGGSFTAVMFVSVGLILNVRMRKTVN